MDKSQALQNFWSGFGLTAYHEATVSHDAEMPYITYSESEDSIGNQILMTASLWYRSLSWEDISKKAQEISVYIGSMHPPAIPIDNGRIYITRGTPFAQRMTDEDPYIRRIVLSIVVEFFTED